MNKKMKMKMCSMLLGLALFAACSSDDDVVTPQPKSYPLTIEVSENPLIPEGGAANAAATRAAETTISSLDKFNMSYVYEGIEKPGSYTDVTCTNGVWGDKTGTAYTWPNGDPDKTVTWYAYTNGSFLLDGSSPYINFTGEEWANGQHDFLVSKTSGTYYNTNGHLYFTFDHACSALRFYVKKATNLNDYTLSISNIKLCHVVKHGKFYYNNNENEQWTLINSSSTDYTNYTLYSGTPALALGSTNYEPIYGTYETDESKIYLFIIPQTLTAWTPSTTNTIATATTQTYLEIDCTITRTSDSYSIYSGKAYIPFGADLAKGTKRDVKINIGKNSLYKADGNKIIN